MTVHEEIKIVPHSPNQMFDLVSDVSKYPEFLPWCLASRIHKNDGKIMIADLLVGFQLLREKFTSKVSLDKNKLVINVEYQDGPFKYLNNYWKFKKHKEGCEIEFNVNFEFKNFLFQSMMENLFSSAVIKMVNAFERRAKSIYDI